MFRVYEVSRQIFRLFERSLRLRGMRYVGLRYVKSAFVHFVLSFVLRVPFLPCNVLLMACS